MNPIQNFHVNSVEAATGCDEQPIYRGLSRYTFSMFSKHSDSITDWQSLTQLYGEMGETELYELHAGIGDLTETAQQVLRDEMRKRGLSEQPAKQEIPAATALLTNRQWDGNNNSAADGDEAGQPSEFTWKVLLCECEDQEQAWQIREVLRQAGIESWIEGLGYRVALDQSNPRIQVAADQLDEARRILANPIPQSIIDQSKMPAEEYEPPVCPSCGAADPVLEGVDPVNSWLCEGCGKQWTDSVEEKSDPSAP
jgi:hypothetical protein